jgi:hypothetical protein
MHTLTGILSRNCSGITGDPSIRTRRLRRNHPRYHTTVNSRGDDVEGFDRRKFLKGSSVAAGLAGAMTVLPGALPAFAKTTQAASRPSAKGSDAAVAASASAGTGATSDPIVAHIRDAGNGQIDLFVGTRHISVKDRNLTNRILNAAS